MGIALGTAVAAAESFGLGTVPIGDIRLHGLDVIQELNLPKYVIPLPSLCVGHPAENPGIKPRFPKEAVYFEEQYNPNLEPLLEKISDLHKGSGKISDKNAGTGYINQSKIILLPM